MRQVKVVDLLEVSPKTVNGSFTLDLIKSKLWLAHILKKILKDNSAGTIYILGSWYGNLILFLQQAGIKFDHIVLVDTEINHLKKSRILFSDLYDDGKITLLHQPAEHISYKDKGVVINCSSNEMIPSWLDNVPTGTLTIIQSRNNASDIVTPTNSLDELNKKFPLSKTIFLKQKSLEDPETEYIRFMKIGLK